MLPEKNWALIMKLESLLRLASANSSVFSPITTIPSKIVTLFWQLLGQQEQKPNQRQLKISAQQETQELITHLSRLGLRLYAWETESYMSATLQALLSIDKLRKKVWPEGKSQSQDTTKLSYMNEIASYFESHSWQPFNGTNRRFTQADPYIFLQYLLPKLALNSVVTRKLVSYPVAVKELQNYVFEASHIPDIVTIGVDRERWGIPVTLTPSLSIPVLGRMTTQLQLKAVIVYHTHPSVINGYYSTFIAEGKEWVEHSEEGTKRHCHTDKLITTLLQKQGYLFLYS